MGRSIPAWEGHGVVVDVGGTGIKYGKARFERGRITTVTDQGSFGVREITSWRDGHARVTEALKLRPKDAKFFSIGAAGVKTPGTDTVLLDRYPGGMLEFGQSGDAGFDNVMVTNDFIVQASAVDTPAADDVFNVRGGIVDPNASGVCMGPGTGFGLAPFPPGKYFKILPSEGGNVSLPVDLDGTEFPRLGGKRPEDEFLRFLREQIGPGRPIRLEQVLSGDGLELCHMFVYGGPRLTADAISALITAGKAEGTREVFGTYLGRKAREAALMFVARRGIYLSGGVIQKNPTLAMDNPWFEAAFMRSPTASHEPLLRDIPIRIFRKPDVALWGAGAYAVTALNREANGCAA